MFLPIWLTVLVFYVLASLFCMSAVFRLSWMATRSPLLSMLSTIGVLIFTPHWNLGGNEIMSSMLLPSTMAWGLALWGWVYLYQERDMMAGVLIGVAAFVQPLVSLQIALMAFLTLGLLMTVTDPRETIRRVVRFAFAFALFALPVLVPLILNQLRSPGSSEALYIIAAFRNPHHYLPDAFPVVAYIKFGTLAVFGGVIFSLSKSQFSSRFWTHAVTTLLGITVALLVAVLGTVILEHALITKLQLFKLTVLAKVILVPGLVVGVFRFVPGSLKFWLEELLRKRLTIIPFASVPLLLAILASSWSPVATRTRPSLARNSSSEGVMLAWIKMNTGKGTVFAIPPTLSGFRYRAERAIFVDFKAFPFHDDEMIEWYRRLLSEAPIQRLARGGTIAMQSLDDAYNDMSPTTVERLVHTEGIHFILRRSALNSESMIPGVQLAHQQGTWWLYQYHTPLNE